MGKYTLCGNLQTCEWWIETDNDSLLLPQGVVRLFLTTGREKWKDMVERGEFFVVVNN